MEGAHVIEVNDLVISMTSKPMPQTLGVHNGKKAEFPLIQKVKRRPYNADEEIYEPSVVSIGPYYHKIQATMEMERRKWESFRYILQSNYEKTMREYIHAMAALEQQVRSSYADEFKIDSDQLLKMVLLDGCFILYVLHGIEGIVEPVSNINKLNTGEGNIELERSVDKPVISIEADPSHQSSSNVAEHGNSIDNMDYQNQWYTSFFIHDLLLLDNQIPFFVIVKIFQLVTDGKTSVSVLLQNVARFMEDLLHSYPKAVLRFDQPKEVHHLLHLCHLYFKPNPIHVNSNPNLGTPYDDGTQSVIGGKQLNCWRQASEYSKTGIKFLIRECCVEDPHSLLDISFCDGVLEMPCLTIDPNTYCLFRNLIAFEETCSQFGNYMTAYVVFLSQFITMPENVSLLTKRGISVDQLDGDYEVSDLFRMLARGVTFDFDGEYYLKHICHAIEMHYQMGRPRWREWLGSISSKLPGSAHEIKPNQLFPRRSSSPADRV